jgi:RTX calcium-binding nonapeptide repeat (4 copies)
MANIIGDKNPSNLNDTLYGTLENDLIIGGAGNDVIGLNEPLDPNLPNFRIVATNGTNNGKDMLYGDIPGNPNVFGNDILYVGNEADDVSNRKFGTVDDIAYGGGGNDVLYGIRLGEDGSWIDDITINENFIYGKLIHKNSRGKLTNEPFSRAYRGDDLYGGDGRDIFYLGHNDRAVDFVKGEDVIYELQKGIFDGRGTLKRVGGNFNRSLSPQVASGFSVSWDLNNIGQEFSAERFTDSTKILKFETSGERGVQREINYSGILMNSAGDEMLLRFPEGIMVVNFDGTSHFISEQGGSVKDGSSDFDFVDFEGYENNTNSYVIGSSAWIKDVRTEFGRYFYEEEADRLTAGVQNWLRQDVFPLVDPFRKSLTGYQQDVTYDYIEFDRRNSGYGQTFSLRYDDFGNETDKPLNGEIAVASNTTALGLDIVGYSDTSEPLTNGAAGNLRGIDDPFAGSFNEELLQIIANNDAFAANPLSRNTLMS